MTTIIDPDVIHSLDPRRSYLPKGVPMANALPAVKEPTRPAPRGSLASLSLDDLRHEIERREKATCQLQAKREKLVAELAEIDAQIISLCSMHDVARIDEPSPQPRKAQSPRANNEVSLADALAMAVEPRAVASPAEAADLVTANGYVSTAKKLAMAVANTLARDLRFKRVGRGQYERVNLQTSATQEVPAIA